MSDIQGPLARALAKQEAELEVARLCEKFGAGNVIDYARAFADRKEHRLWEAYAKWRNAMRSTITSPSASDSLTKRAESK